MKKYDIEKFIEFVADLVNEFDIFCEREVDSRYYFKNGGCYELYKIVKHYFPESKCVISKDLRHCAIFYNWEIYDITGKILENENYTIAQDIDFLYMESFFGIDLNELNNENIIKELDKCRIKGKLYE